MRSLFERADAARLAGRPAEAAQDFDELRRRYPGDARAGYAAFMLGRIRLDTLGDPSGAAEAFAFAIAHPGAAASSSKTPRSGASKRCTLLTKLREGASPPAESASVQRANDLS